MGTETAEKQRIGCIGLSKMGMANGESTCEEAIPLIANGSIQIKPMITHVFPLDQFAEAYRIFTERLDRAVKVIVKP